MLSNLSKASRTVFLFMAGLMLVVLASWLMPGLGFSQNMVPSPQIVVKFADGLEVGLTNGQISGQLACQSKGKKASGGRGLNEKRVASEIEQFNEILNHPGIVSIKPLFTQNASGLQPEGPMEGESDLRLYFTLVIKDLSDQDIQSLLSRTHQLSIVDTAYQAPIPEDPGMETPSN